MKSYTHLLTFNKVGKLVSKLGEMGWTKPLTLSVDIIEWFKSTAAWVIAANDADDADDDCKLFSETLHFSTVINYSSWRRTERMTC